MRLRTFSMAVAGLFAAPPLCLTAVPAAAQQPAADTSAPVVYNEPRVTITPDRSRPALIEIAGMAPMSDMTAGEGFGRSITTTSAGAP